MPGHIIISLLPYENSAPDLLSMPYSLCLNIGDKINNKRLSFFRDKILLNKN